MLRPSTRLTLDSSVDNAQVYENVTFGGVKHLRIADQEGMFERTVTLCSASKLFSLTGEATT